MDYSIQERKTIVLKSNNKLVQIDIKTIVFISCDSYLLHIHILNKEKPEIFSKPLKEVESELSNLHFLRINRSELINMKFFKSYHNNGSRKITLSTGMTLFVSRRKWVNIKNYFEN